MMISLALQISLVTINCQPIYFSTKPLNWNGHIMKQLAEREKAVKLIENPKEI